MSDAMITRDMLVEVFASVPTTKQGVLDPAWLSGVLAHLAAVELGVGALQGAPRQSQQSGS